MKKILHSLALLLVWCLALAGGREARASHAQAGELTYFSLGNNQYRVRATFFRDCGGISAPTQFALTCRPGGCTAGPTVTAILLPPAGYPTSPASFTTYSPYCPSVAATQPGCTPNSNSPINALSNTISINYEAVVTLPPAAEWVLSVEENARPQQANITGGTLRLEATLNNLITPVGGGAAVAILNNSPQFNRTTLPVPFVCWQQSTTLSFSATDADLLNIGPNGVGRPDSLVYSLDRPLNGCGTFETYSAYPSTCTPTVINGTCILTCPPGGNNYTATLPIAVGNDTLGTCVAGAVSTLTVRPRFDFNAQAASMTFTPSLFNPTPDAFQNKYTVVGKVTEFRRINGRMYKVGSVRRDFLVIVIDCRGNVLPSTPVGTAGPPRSNVTLNITRDTTDVTVYSCNYSRVRFNFTDPNNAVTPPPVPLQNLTVFYPNDLASNILQSGDIGTFSIARNGTPTPTLVFYFQPLRSFNGQTILIPFRIEDDGCPAKAIQYRTLRVRIINDPRAAQAVAAAGSSILTGLGASTICEGSSLNFTGSVNRPDSVRNVSTGLVRLQTYRYQWAAVTGPNTMTTMATPENGLPALTNTSNIVVRPTRTTRYRLSIEPTLGLGTGCGDTTTYLVRVAPTDSIDFKVVSVRSSRPVVPGKPAGAPVPPITFKFQNTSFLSYAPGTTKLNPLDPAVGFKIDGVRWAYQRVKDGKGEPVTNSQVTDFTPTVAPGQAIPDTLSLKLTQSGTYNILLQSSVFQTVGLTTPQRLACQTLAKIRTVVVPNVDMYNVITPNNDGLNDTFVVGPELQGGTLTIYNRWGRKIEELNNYQNTWSAENQAPGVYYYLLTDTNDNTRKGWVEVIK